MVTAANIGIWVVVAVFLGTLGAMAYRRAHTAKFQDKDATDFEHLPMRSGPGERMTGVHMEPPVTETGSEKREQPPKAA